MVSTRSVKNSKFSEGEKVLCYEPDPAKTKVLYNSKVLEIGQKKDEHGRNVAHFLIHFQGWNSTWDRFVTEDYILKDTEENRKLQKLLAEKAQLTARGGNLYRRGRKKRTLSRVGSDNERGGVKGGGGGGGGADSDSEGESEPKAQTNFSPVLQSILELDQLLITKQNKVHKLPAAPNAVEILELFIREFTINQIKLMCHRRGHLRPTAGKFAHITVHDINARSNLCREIADGLRVYLDFMTNPALLYNEERAQYKFFTDLPMPVPPAFTGSHKHSHHNECTPLKRKEDGSRQHHTSENKEENDLKSASKDTERRKSLRSHSEVSSSTHPTLPPPSAPLPPAPNLPLTVDSKSVSCLNKLDPTLLEGQVDLASLLGQNVVKGGEHLILRPMSQKEREHLKRLVHRKIVSEIFYKTKCSETNTPPCLIYGATHLARALVKIPEIFPNSEHSESKMTLINEYLVGFTKFLEEHPEWFGEHAYTTNTYSEVPMDGIK